MNWTDLKITVSTKDAETAEAIAQMAVPYGIYIEDYSDMLELVPQIAHIDLIDEDLLARSRTEAILHLYLPPEENPAEASAFLTHRLEAEGIPYRIETDQTLAEEDWANAWKRFYHPTHLGKRLVVCPSWEEYTPTPEELVMTLDPGMAFGTGTHETTNMCMQLLERCLKPGLRVMDVGTGSGILAIAAAKLGAQNVLAIDIDPDAVKVAKENVELNHVTKQVRVVVGDLCKSEAMPCEVAVANIVADAICMLAGPMTRHLVKGGLLICSGIIREREADVQKAAKEAGYRQVDRIEKGEWVALCLKNEA